MNRVFLQTIVLLLCSNVFMTFAWYGHLRELGSRPLLVAVFYMKQPIKLDFLWAGLCLMGAVYFIFRS